MRAGYLGTKTETFIMYQANENICACIKIWILSHHAAGDQLRAPYHNALQQVGNCVTRRQLCNKKMTLQQEDNWNNAEGLRMQLKTSVLGLEEQRSWLKC